MSLQRSLTLFRQRVMQENEQTRRAVILEVFGSTILDTPVDTGRARGNWQTSVAQPINSESTRTGEAPSMAELQRVTAQSKWGEEVWMTNNLPYIGKLEYGGYPNPPRNPLTSKTINGFSRQAPNGMLRRNIRRVYQILRSRGIVR